MKKLDMDFFHKKINILFKNFISLVAERKGETYGFSMHWFTFQMVAVTAAAGHTRSQELHVGLAPGGRGSRTWVVIFCFVNLSAGSWTGSAAPMWDAGIVGCGSSWCAVTLAPNFSFGSTFPVTSFEW